MLNSQKNLTEFLPSSLIFRINDVLSNNKRQSQQLYLTMQVKLDQKKMTYITSTFKTTPPLIHHICNGSFSVTDLI